MAEEQEGENGERETKGQQREERIDAFAGPSEGRGANGESKRR